MKTNNEMIRRRIMAAVEISIMKNQLVISCEKAIKKDGDHPLSKIAKVRQNICLFKFSRDAILASLADHEQDKQGKVFYINMEESNAPL